MKTTATTPLASALASAATEVASSLSPLLACARCGGTGRWIDRTNPLIGYDCPVAHPGVLNGVYLDPDRVEVVHAGPADTDPVSVSDTTSHQCADECRFVIRLPLSLVPVSADDLARRHPRDLRWS